MKKLLNKKQRLKRCNSCTKVKIIETSGTVKCRGITGGADLFMEPPITCNFYRPRAFDTLPEAEARLKELQGDK